MLTWVLPDDGLTDAACRDADPELFAVTQPQHAEPAREFCRQCTVTDACLAMMPALGCGVWGGQVFQYGRPGRNIGRPRLSLVREPSETSSRPG